MRPKVVAGNWKMHTLLGEARELAGEVLKVLQPRLRASEKLRVILCPPSLWLTEVGDILSGSAVELGAQDTHFEPKGAFTGAVSAGMLNSAGVQNVIVGHSERRRLFGETDDIVNRKVLAVLDNDMRPIICVGETTPQRNSGKTNQVVLGQVRAALQGAVEAVGGTESLQHQLPCIAYEPIWAIGSGTPATPEDAAEVASLVRETLAFELGEFAAERVPILYGGSVKPANAASFASCAELDGVLVGGASLDAKDFAAVAAAFDEVRGSTDADQN